MKTFVTDEKINPVAVKIQEGKTKSQFFVYGKTAQEIESYLNDWIGSGDVNGAPSKTKRQYRKKSEVAPRSGDAQPDAN